MADLNVSVNEAVATRDIVNYSDWSPFERVFFVDFAAHTFAFNGVDIPVYTTNGTSWTAVPGAPWDGKYPEVYQQRIYALSEAGILHQSDIVNEYGTGLTSSTWTNRGINPDSQKCKGLIRHRGRLIIFKTESLYRYDGTNEPEATIEIGTHSETGFVVLGNLYFHHRRSIYKMGVGDPIKISRAVQKYLDGMSSDNWEHVAAGRDEENVYFWIGDVTITDKIEYDYNETYYNVVLVYNIYSESWTIFTNWNARVFYFDKTTGKLYFGTAAGKVFEANLNYADVDGATIASIDFRVVFHPQDFGVADVEKEVGRISATGSYGWSLTAANNKSDLSKEENRSVLEDGVANIPVAITGKKIWTKIETAYNDIPPVVEKLIFDDVKLEDNET